MRALITGITGFVGSHLAHHLARRGWQVSGLATGPSNGALEVFDVRQVDIADQDSLKRTLEEVDPEVIFHLAGLAHVGMSWQRPGDYLRVNFGGTRHLVAAAGSRRVLFASSAEVYGQVPAEEQPLLESRQVEPRSPYAMTKACAELVVVESGGIVVRSFNATGPGQSRQFALPSFAYQLAQIQLGKRSPRISVGDLSPCRDFLHIADAVEAYRLLAEKGQAGETYNVASGQAVAIGDALRLLQQISGVEAEVAVDPSLVRKIDIPLLQGQIGKIMALGWKPSKSLADALNDLWRWTLEASEAEEAVAEKAAESELR
jgi:GDP-4-dehydro-6-deoxy-D-mannose reductase